MRGRILIRVGMGLFLCVCIGLSGCKGTSGTTSTRQPESTATALSGTTTVDGATPSPALPSLRVILAQAAPDCHNPAGTVWNRPGSTASTSLTCGSDGLTMSQPTGEHYAEIDLDEVDHGAYSQTCFLVQVDATFPNRGNLNTYATLLVQTPIAANQFGGITLLVNSAGAWQLEQVTSALTMPMLASGTAILTSPTAVLAVQVCHLELNAMVNNKIVATIADSLNGSSSVIGLLVEQQGAPSSPVVYSSFKLEQAT